MVGIHLLRNPWQETGQKFSIFASCNSAEDCSISRKFGTEFDHADALQAFKVKGQSQRSYVKCPLISKISVPERTSIRRIQRRL